MGYVYLGHRLDTLPLLLGDHGQSSTGILQSSGILYNSDPPVEEHKLFVLTSSQDMQAAAFTYKHWAVLFRSIRGLAMHLFALPVCRGRYQGNWPFKNTLSLRSSCIDHWRRLLSGALYPA